MSKICKKCDTLITFGDNNYCELCANELVADLEAKHADMTEKYNACQEARKLEIEFNKQDKAQLKQQLADAEFRYDNLYNLYYKDTEELKQQLANKEIEIKTWETLYGSVMKSCHNGIEEDKRLREQLAEKEKEIENLKEQFDVFTIKNAFKYQNVIEKSKMQFAIDYAIEQLEELRLSFICNYHDNISWIDDRENSCCLNLTTTIYNTTMDIFENQVKQLKEMK